MKYPSFVPQHRVVIQPISDPFWLKTITYIGGYGEQVRYIRTPPAAAAAKSFHVSINRNMMRVKVAGRKPEHLKDSKRGQVKMGFSGKSRNRMLEKFNSLRLPMRNVVFVHLTYPAVYSHRWQDWKDNLKAFKRLLKRRFPDSVGMWKLELQKRGAPHYHMLIDLGQGCSIRRFRKWLDAAWGRIAHDLDMYGGKYACRAEMVLSIRHAMNYAAKYCSKVTSAPMKDDGTDMQWSDLGTTIGRQWGVIGKPDFSQSDGLSMDILSLSYVRLRIAIELKQRGIKWWKRVAKSSGKWSFNVFGIGDDSDYQQIMAQDFLLKVQLDYVNSDNPTRDLWLMDDWLWRGDNGSSGA